MSEQADSILFWEYSQSKKLLSHDQLLLWEYVDSDVLGPPCLLKMSIAARTDHYCDTRDMTAPNISIIE